MIKLPHIFADNALFMGGAILKINGKAFFDSKVSVEIRSDKGVFSSGETVADAEGNFAVEINCPESSFEKYEIVFNDGDELVLKNILFGELWLASGQSNMEMPNSEQPDYPEYLDGMSYDTVRTYRMDTRAGDGEYPIEPSSEKFGEWIDLTQEERLMRVSAVATVFAGRLFNDLGKKVPIGVVDCSMGATFLETWLPKSEIEKDDSVKQLVESKGRLISEAEWNTKGSENFQQAGALYNDKTAALLGVKFRGLLWYQGEGNCGDGPDYYLAIYKFMQRVYSEKFGYDKNNFPMISSLLYPWDYGINTPTLMNRLNEAYIRAADEDPKIFSFVTNYDLSPMWTCWRVNHPIHPANKSFVGRRMVEVAKNLVYGFDGQKTPAYMESFDIIGDRVRVKFKNVGRGLYCNGDYLKGFNICGKNRIFAPAKAEIVGRDTIEIYNEYISEPVSAAYNYSQFDVSGNLWAGQFSVAPFITNGTASDIIRLKPWLDLNNETEWVLTHSKDVWETYCFSHPIWTACEGSEICHDPVYMGKGKTLRISSDKNSFGACVVSRNFYELDLYRYDKIILDAFSARDNLSAYVEFEIEYDEKKEKVCFDGVITNKNSKGVKTFEFDISGLNVCDIRSMAFKFNVSDGVFPFVNICDIKIVPKPGDFQ